MFVISYKFTVKTGENTSFEKAWKEVTHLIYMHRGSFGSRLYKTGNNTYLGIAQWPDKATWEQATDLDSADTLNWREKMRESCESIEKADEMELIHDLWRNKTFDQSI